MQSNNRMVAPGVRLLSLPDDRFKTTGLTVALLMPLSETTAAANALLPFLLRRNCEKYPDFSALNLRLNQLYGATVSADVSRIGNMQALLLTAGCINDAYVGDGESLVANCADLLLQMLFRPALEDGVFRSEDLEQERRCMVERIEAEINEKRVYARHQCEKLLCEGEPFAINRFGTKEQVLALTAQEVTDAWKAMLRTARIQVIGQGSGDFDSVARMIERAFEAFNRAPVEDLTDGIPMPETIRRKTKSMEVTQCKMVMGFRTPVVNGNRLMPAMRLMNALLGGTANSYLFKNVREKLSLCYYCSSSYDRHQGIVLIDSGVMEENVEKADKAIHEQLEAIQNGAFTDDELSSARLSVMNQLRSLNDLQATQAAWYLSQWDADTMQTPETAVEELVTVTREQVVEAAHSLVGGSLYLLKPTETGKKGD